MLTKDVRTYAEADIETGSFPNRGLRSALTDDHEQV